MPINSWAYNVAKRHANRLEIDEATGIGNQKWVKRYTPYMTHLRLVVHTMYMYAGGSVRERRRITGDMRTSQPEKGCAYTCARETSVSVASCTLCAHRYAIHRHLCLSLSLSFSLSLSSSTIIERGIFTNDRMNEAPYHEAFLHGLCNVQNGDHEISILEEKER